jgi:hypothetical protein
MPAKQPPKQPNILIIWGDDIGWWNPSCYHRGVMGYRTPNIDRIAAEGALPPRQRPSSFSIDAALEKARETQKTLASAVGDEAEHAADHVGTQPAASP